ncbi:MAG TPA: CDP-alcohol phosphatidyltransferase family protein, partial [Candidatus Saccharimonadales bacterium]|nr:CDP-alcohol phosphatidyltransferase family protein [Candidatus Saccharimonadales bacterium]
MKHKPFSVKVWLEVYDSSTKARAVGPHFYFKENPLSESAVQLAGVQRYEQGGRDLAARLGGTWLGRKGVPADWITLAGAVTSIVACAGWCFQVRWSPAFWAAFPVAILGAWFDAIDGGVARASEAGPTKFGEVLDSVCDRLVEGAMFTALAVVLYKQSGGLSGVIACMAALAGSITVSYARSKAENLQLDGKAGFGSRGV